MISHVSVRGSTAGYRDPPCASKRGKTATSRRYELANFEGIMNAIYFGYMRVLVSSGVHTALTTTDGHLAGFNDGLDGELEDTRNNYEPCPQTQ